jgi:NitT/TauT family transport system substrate-binding protein
VVAAVPGSDSAGLYIAAERGYFSKQGLNVSIVPAASTSTAIAGQLAGKYDVTFGNYVSYIRAAAIGNAKLKVLAPGAVMGPDTQMIMVPANSPITSVPQLQGKRIAVNVKQNIGTVLVDSVLTNNAILPSASNVHYVAMPFPEMITALREHKVDAAWMAEPFVTDAEETIGAQPLADTDQGVTQNLPVDGYVATQKWARNYPRTAAAFQRAIVAGQRIAAADVGAVVQAVTKYARIPTATAALLRDPTYPTQLDPVAIQRVADLMLQFNEIPHGFTVSSMTR